MILNALSQDSPTAFGLRCVQESWTDPASRSSKKGVWLSEARGWFEKEVAVPTQQRGFASMDPKKQREIASKGGKAAHAKGTAHEWTKEEAREAGRKGGMLSHQRKPRDKTEDVLSGAQVNRITR